MYTKIFIGSWMLLSLILWYSLTFWESKDMSQEKNAQERVNYEEAQRIAQEYINSNLWNEFWKDEIPTLWERTPMYMEKDEPSYIEYELLCKKENGCGFIVINVDGDDVKMPLASIADIPPSKILTKKSWSSKEGLKFYYFSLFSIYAENIHTHKLNAFDPEVDPIEYDTLQFIPQKDQEKIRQMLRKKQEQIPKIFKEEQKKIIAFKHSEVFQQYKQKIWEQNASSDEFIIPQSPWSEVIGNFTYISPLYFTSDCTSIVPCYKQHAYQYDGEWCASGCSPVAAGIIYGYHDRKNNYPLLLPNYTAEMTNAYNSPESSMINEIRGYMGTYCSGAPNWSGKTPVPNGIEQGKKYGWYHNYWGTQSIYMSVWEPQYVLGHLKWQVNQWKPIMINVKKIGEQKAHTIVWMGYYNYTQHKRIYINAGWGNNLYAFLLIDLDSIAFDTNFDFNAVYSVVTLNVSN